MSKNHRQQHLNQQQEKSAEELHKEAVEKLNAKPSKEGIEAPEFAKDAQVQEEVVKEEKKEANIKVQVESLPDHIQTEKQNKAQSNTLDLDSIRKQLSSGGGLCLEVFLKYMNDMAPNKPVSIEEGARYQANLWSGLDIMFNRLDDNDFNILYRAVLNLFNEHKDGVFSDERVYRVVEHWVVSDAQSAAMRRLLNLMLVTRDPGTRYKAVRELKNWDYILEFGLTEQAKNRIRNFYDL